MHNKVLVSSVRSAMLEWLSTKCLLLCLFTYVLYTFYFFSLAAINHSMLWESSKCICICNSYMMSLHTKSSMLSSEQQAHKRICYSLQSIVHYPISIPIPIATLIPLPIVIAESQSQRLLSQTVN